MSESQIKDIWAGKMPLFKRDFTTDLKISYDCYKQTIGIPKNKLKAKGFTKMF